MCWLYIVTSDGYRCTRSLDAGALDTSACPGATTSGFAKPSYQVGPDELYGAIRSSLLIAVSKVLLAPTVIASGALPGEVMPAYPSSPVSGLRPMFPAATTTISPARVARSTS